jgi:hypothetical protein
MILNILDAYTAMTYNQAIMNIKVSSYDLEDSKVGGVPNTQYPKISNLFENLSIAEMPKESKSKELKQNNVNKKNTENALGKKKNKGPKKGPKKQGVANVIMKSTKKNTKGDKKQLKQALNVAKKQIMSGKEALHRAALNEIKQVKSLTDMICDPESNWRPENSRWPRIDDSTKTTTYCATLKSPVQWPATTFSTGLLDQDMMFITLQPIAECGSIEYYSNVNKYSHRYNIMQYDNTTNAVAFTISAPTDNLLHWCTYSYAQWTALDGYTQVSKPHGDFWAAGNLSIATDARLFFLAPGEAIGLKYFVPNTWGTDKLQFATYLYSWDPENGLENVASEAGEILSGGSHESTFEINNAGGDILSTPMGAYYTIAYQIARIEAGVKNNNNSTPRKIPQRVPYEEVRKRNKTRKGLPGTPFDYITMQSFITNGSGDSMAEDGVPTFGHRLAYGFEKAISDFQEHSVNAQSLWYENTAQEASRCGSIYSEQEPGSTHWLATINNLTGYINRNISKEIPGSNGAYSFRKPTTQCFDFRNYHRVSDATSAITDTFWPIDHVYQRLTMVIKMPLTDLGNSQSGLWKITNAMEWVTLDATRTIGVSRYPSKVGLQAIDAVKNMRQHFENASHFKQILNAAKKAVNIATKGIEVASLFL